MLRGIYLPNDKARDLAFIKRLHGFAGKRGVNMYVLDMQLYDGMRPIYNSHAIEYLQGEGVYLAARVVCFQGGLTRLPPPEAHMQQLRHIVRTAIEAGFPEVQLDYIRMADRPLPYNLEQRYSAIAQILGEFREMADERGVVLSADIFGRIPFNQDDRIGQQIELFAEHVHVLHPMLYPSHFYGEPGRRENPGRTVRDGTRATLMRLKGRSDRNVQPYIQVFSQDVERVGLSLERYIELQIIGAEEAGGRGWIAWNALGYYAVLFRAMDRLQESGYWSQESEQPQSTDDAPSEGKQPASKNAKPTG